MKKDILKQIYDVLASDGTKVYFPGQFKGECVEKYIVLKSGATAKLLTVSSERPTYTIMFYVPKNNYTQFESFIRETKQKMKKIFPLVMYDNGSETESYYDEDLKAHTKSIMYVGCRKIEYW